MQTEFTLACEEHTLNFGRRLGQYLHPGMVVYLDGTLGAGKTTLCRGILESLGHIGPVKSPTYTLVEPYYLEAHTIYHFDLYRLADAEELEFLGIRDYFGGAGTALIEWPNKGAGFIPAFDILFDLKPEGEGRKLTIITGTEKGVVLLSLLTT